MKNKHTIPPCHKCTGKCCKYFALELDQPTTIHDFENLKWYLLHENTMIFHDEGSWFLQINNKCKYLGNDYSCQIYHKRPSICKEYSFDEHNTINCMFTELDVKV